MTVNEFVNNICTMDTAGDSVYYGSDSTVDFYFEGSKILLVKIIAELKLKQVYTVLMTFGISVHLLLNTKL